MQHFGCRGNDHVWPCSRPTRTCTFLARRAKPTIALSFCCLLISASRFRFFNLLTLTAIHNMHLNNSIINLLHHITSSSRRRLSRQPHAAHPSWAGLSMHYNSESILSSETSINHQNNTDHRSQAYQHSLLLLLLLLPLMTTSTPKRTPTPPPEPEQKAAGSDSLPSIGEYTL
jgi:hypothetical protein